MHGPYIKIGKVRAQEAPHHMHTCVRVCIYLGSIWSMDDCLASFYQQQGTYAAGRHEGRCRQRRRWWRACCCYCWWRRQRRRISRSATWTSTGPSARRRPASETAPPGRRSTTSSPVPRASTRTWTRACTAGAPTCRMPGRHQPSRPKHKVPLPLKVAAVAIDHLTSKIDRPIFFLFHFISFEAARIYADPILVGLCICICIFNNYWPYVSMHTVIQIYVLIYTYNLFHGRTCNVPAAS